MTSSYRQSMIRLFTFLGGIYFAIEFLLPAEIYGFKFGKYHEEISIGFAVMSVMAIGLGILNLLFAHGSRVAFKRSGWINSLGLLLSLFAMMTMMCLDWRNSHKMASSTQQITMLASFSEMIIKDVQENTPGVADTNTRTTMLYDSINKMLKSVRMDHQTEVVIDELNTVSLNNYKADLKAKVATLTELVAVNKKVEPNLETLNQISGLLGELAVAQRRYLKLIYDFSIIKQVYNLLYDGLFISLGSAMFALLGFYIAGAAYRAFRIKSTESALMMAAAIVVMLGQIPFGIWIWDGFTGLRLWLLQIPSSGAFRAIYFGASIAGLGMAFRMWLSIESESFSTNHKEQATKSEL